MQTASRRCRVRVPGMAALLVPVVLVLASGCASLGYIDPEDLEVRILDVDVGLPRSDVLPLKFRALITNFSSATMHVRTVRYRLWVNENELVEGRLRTVASLEGDNTVEVELPLDVRYDALGKGLRSLVRLNDNRYRLVGVIEVDALFGTIDIPFESEGKI